MNQKERIEKNISNILELKESGMTYKEIAQIYNSSASTIGRVLRENGNTFKAKINEEDITKMIGLYNDGYAIKGISEMFHISEITVSNYLKSHDVHIRNNSECKQLYTLNESYFDNIDIPNKAYLLGWLWSDGHNCIRNNAVIISLQYQDRYILEFFNKELESNRPIKFIDRSNDTDYNRQNQYRLSIVNKHMSKRLLELGMDHDKGLTAHFPKELPADLFSHFIRGYFDGDGYICKNPKDCRMNITGTVWLCESVQAILKNSLGVNSYMVIPHNKINKPTRTLWIAGRNQVKKVLDYFYNNAEYYLIRKHEIYQKIYIA